MMQASTFQLKRRTDTTAHVPVVQRSALLQDVLATVRLDDSRYLLVEDERGNLLGAVSVNDLQQRSSFHNPIERSRWLEMSMDIAMEGHLSPLSDTNPHEAPPSEVSVIRDGTGVVALVTESDLYVRWSSIRSSISGAWIDPVTGLPSRAMFERRLSEEFVRAQRSGVSLAIGMIDLDHFKQINDQHGHSVGDQALQAVAQHLQRELRSYDFVGRFGGDEFAIICTGCRPSEIDIPIRRIQQKTASLFADGKLSTDDLRVTLSIGVAVAHDPAQLSSASQLVEWADQCLYAAKRAGRNCAHKIEHLHQSTEQLPQFMTRIAIMEPTAANNAS